MGISLSFCRLSKKRESMLLLDSTLCWELSSEVPGFLEVGKAWDALRLATERARADALVVRFFAGELGKSFGEPGAFSKPRIVAKGEVASLAQAMRKVAAGFIADHLDELRGAEVHGRYFDDDADESRLQALEHTFTRARDLVLETADRGDALLLMFR